MGIFFALLFCILQATSMNGDKITLPVLMLDVENIMKVEANTNPFFKISTFNFADIIQDSVRNSQTVIMFIEEYLSTEDLSAKDKLDTLYPHLRTALKDKKAKYFPAVTQPFRVLTHILQPQEHNTFRLNHASKIHQLMNNNLKYMYVYFDDGANGTRLDFLRIHDRIMSDVYFAVRKMRTGPIVAFYTGKTNPVVIEIPELVQYMPRKESSDMSVIIASDGALFRFIGVFTANANRRANFNQMPQLAKETRTDSRLTTRMTYTDFELEFYFSFQPEGWQLDSVALLEGDEEVGRTRMEAGAPWGWSYECGEPLVIVNSRDNSFVTISQYQIQPRARRTKMRGGVPLEDGGDAEGGGGEAEGGGGEAEGGGEEGAGGETGGEGQGGNDTCFSSAVNCGPYFNTNILAGLLVTFMCLAVAGWGVVMLAGCNSNNRYDDPQGKPLSPSELH